MAEIVPFPSKPPFSQPASFTRPTPLNDDGGHQIGIAAPGQRCEVMAVYKWTPGPGSPERERAKVLYRGRVHDVDRESVWVDE
jgi:hypothetical protein